MIRTENLSYSYGEKQVLKGVSFSAEEGRMTALLGKNGAGKTTLFRCILGILSDYGGEITIAGKPVRQMNANQIARNISYIPQIHYPSFNYSVLDMVLMGTGSRVYTFSTPKKAQYDEALAALARVGISHLADSDYFKISGGEQQLTLIARALAQGSHTLLMDEPTASLDFGNQIRALEQAEKLVGEGYTILMSSHNPQHVLTYCDKVIALKDGQALYSGKPDETITKELISELYGVNVTIEDVNNTRVILPNQKGQED